MAPEEQVREDGSDQRHERFAVAAPPTGENSDVRARTVCASRRQLSLGGGQTDEEPAVRDKAVALTPTAASDVAAPALPSLAPSERIG